MCHRGISHLDVLSESLHIPNPKPKHESATLMIRGDSNMMPRPLKPNRENEMAAVSNARRIRPVLEGGGVAESNSSFPWLRYRPQAIKEIVQVKLLYAIEDVQTPSSASESFALSSIAKLYIPNTVVPPIINIITQEMNTFLKARNETEAPIMKEIVHRTQKVI